MTGRRLSQRLNWSSVILIALAHLLALFAILYLSRTHFSWWTVGLGVVWLFLCGLSITGGYHRLYSHRSYRASAPLRALYLLFGAASVQNSALKWSSDHRVHHQNTDQEQDPYNITRGFWWAHIGWIFFQDDTQIDTLRVRDIHTDPLVRFQHRHYILLAILAGGLMPLALGTAWGDPLGALLVAGVLRLVVQWHMTFAVNSVAHALGSQPYGGGTSARDSVCTALITLGEGYHNFHHRFPSDYRNGVRWFQYDPTKWFIWLLSKIKMTGELKRIPRATLLRERFGSGARSH